MKKLFRLGMGIAVLLMALFSLWLAIIPQSAVNKADRATSRSDLYDQARYAVSSEELQVQQYRNDPGPAATARYQRAVAAGTNDLLTLSHDGETNDWIFAQKELALLSRYHILAQQMFVASDVGDTALLHQASQSGEPIAVQLELEMNTAASQHRQQALQNQGELRSVLLAALLATPVVIGGGLLLFSSCWLLLATYHSRVERVVLTDALTHLPNHRALMDRLEKEKEHAQRYGHPFSLLFFDADHFKRVNDTYGHSTGDVVLRELGSRVRSQLRGEAIVGRYGGEEFLVLLPETGLAEAYEVAERVRKAIAAHALATSAVNEGIPTTISMGIATFPDEGLTVGELVEKADQAMYWAKRLGRNQVRTAQEAERFSQDQSLAATISNLERHDDSASDELSQSGEHDPIVDGTATTARPGHIHAFK
ncbi:MAG: GGDEF domain-containing protein [Ktedonobacteraceae bacterium]